MKIGKKYLALLLAAVVATGSLQIPACAETKNESSVQKETGEEIGVQMQNIYTGDATVDSALKSIQTVNEGIDR